MRRPSTIGACLGATLLGTAALAQPAGRARPEIAPNLTLDFPVVLDEPEGEKRVVVEIDGQDREIVLSPVSVRAPSFRVRVIENGVTRFITPPAARTYRGLIEGAPGWTAVMSIGESVSGQVISPGGELWGVEPRAKSETADAPGEHVVYRADGSVPGFSCGAHPVTDGEDVVDVGREPSGGSAPAGESGLRIADLAVDTDFELFQAEGSVEGVVALVEDTINRANLIYERDVLIKHAITEIVVRTTPDDPYGDGVCIEGPGGLFTTFQSEWNTNLADVPRDVATMISAHDLPNQCQFAGLALIGTVCKSMTGYSVSVITGFNGVQRTNVVAHELGHNWSARHCDEQCFTCDCADFCGVMNSILQQMSGELSFGPCAKGLIDNYASLQQCLDIDTSFGGLLPPLADAFEGGSFDPTLWTQTEGAELSEQGLKEPSGAQSARVAAGGALGTSVIALDQDLFPTPLYLSFWTQHQGVEAGEQFVVEYYFWLLDTFVPLVRVESDGNDQQSFRFHEFELPPAAYSDLLRVRFRSESNDADDAWFVDDFALDQFCRPDLNIDLSLDQSDLDQFITIQQLQLFPFCDWNLDGACDVLDWARYFDAFLRGCY